MGRLEAAGKDALSKVEELVNASRLSKLLTKREDEEKKKAAILWALAIIGAVAAIAFVVYKFFTPDCLEDFEDDFDEDFDDDYFENENADA